MVEGLVCINILDLLMGDGDLRESFLPMLSELPMAGSFLPPMDISRITLFLGATAARFFCVSTMVSKTLY